MAHAENAAEKQRTGMAMDPERIASIMADMRSMGVLEDDTGYIRLNAIMDHLTSIKRHYRELIAVVEDCNMRDSLSGRNLHAALGNNMERFGFLFGMVSVMQWINEEHQEGGCYHVPQQTGD